MRHVLYVMYEENCPYFPLQSHLHTLYLAQEWAIIFTQMSDESISKRLLASSEAEKNMYNCY
jgi:hypothetical protein